MPLESPARSGQRWLRQKRVPGWLRSLAFHLALRRAYRRFARHYPEWVANLFDAHFLTHSAAPLLARRLQQATLPSPTELAVA